MTTRDVRLLEPLGELSVHSTITTRNDLDLPQLTSFRCPKPPNLLGPLSLQSLVLLCLMFGHLSAKPRRVPAAYETYNTIVSAYVDPTDEQAVTLCSLGDGSHHSVPEFSTIAFLYVVFTRCLPPISSFAARAPSSKRGL